jgi:hypothetical protein
MTTPGSLAQEAVAKAMAASSAGIAGWTWIATANDLLQLVATAIGIIAGIYAIVWHRVRIEEVKKKVEAIHEEVVQNEQSNRDGAGEPPRDYR